MSIVLSVSDLSGEYGTKPVLKAKLSDNTPLANRSITFTIHGKSYNRTTNNKGECSLTINLEPGVYDCTVRFNGDMSYEPIIKVVEVNILPASTRIVADNFSKKYKKSGRYQFTVFGVDNNVLSGFPCVLEINGVMYNRITDSNGQARLNINLDPGVYQIRITTLTHPPYKETTIYRTIEVLKQDTHMDGTNIVKNATETAVYQCAIYNENNERVHGKVNLKVNGVTYIRNTESDGLARLNIRLWAGEYTIKAWFGGDQFYHGSSISNTIKVKIEGKQALSDAESIKGIKSKIYVGGYPDASNGVILDNNVITQLEKAMPEGITWTDYEINETDRRTKTAKFTTPSQLDLSANLTYVVITNPYHENFGGVILSEEYDAQKDLYTYQCQDWRRQYITKMQFQYKGNAKIYDLVESLITAPFVKTGTRLTVPLTNELRNIYKKQLSGLLPLKMYTVQIAGLKPMNYFDRTAENYLAYDSVLDVIFNLALQNNNNLDIYFDMYGVLHLDPIDWDKWINTGLLLTTEDIAEYKYGFDTTNILTGVMVKDANYGTRVFNNNENDVGKKVSEDLTIIFGKHVGIADAPQWETQTTTNNTTTTTQNTTIGYGKCGVSNDKKTIMAIGKPSSWQDSKYSYSGWYKSIFKNYCPKCKKEGVLIWGQGWAGGTANYGYLPCKGNSEGGSYEGHIFCTACDADYSCLSGGDHLPNSVELTRADGGSPVRSSQEELDKLKNGQMSTTTQNTTSSNTTDTAAVAKVDVNDPNYIAAQYRKAIKEYSKSVRSLMKFSIKVPLNSPFFKYLHTNSFLFTDLPEQFALVNLPKIYKNLANYSVNRGVPYVKNRWYIEAIKIKHDGKGLWADITLNAFPSDQSSFQSAIDSYISAYDNAFNKKTETTESSTSTSTNNSSTSSEQIFKEIANICQQYRYSLGKGVSSYSGMKQAGHGDCWAFAELVFQELKARGCNACIWQYATDESSRHRSAGYMGTDGIWYDFDYRRWVTNPKACVNGGNNWYFNFRNNKGISPNINSYTGGKKL